MDEQTIRYMNHPQIRTVLVTKFWVNRISHLLPHAVSTNMNFILKTWTIENAVYVRWTRESVMCLQDFETCDETGDETKLSGRRKAVRTNIKFRHIVHTCTAEVTYFTSKLLMSILKSVQHSWMCNTWFGAVRPARGAPSKRTLIQRWIRSYPGTVNGMHFASEPKPLSETFMRIIEKSCNWTDKRLRKLQCEVTEMQY